MPAHLSQIFLVPVGFSGDEAVTGLLPHGPCRDFNVIWNPLVATASVTIVRGDVLPITETSGDLLCGLLCVSKSVELSANTNLEFADFVVLDGSDVPVIIVNGTALLVRIGSL